jgi:sialic acid synthase SpsE
MVWWHQKFSDDSSLLLSASVIEKHFTLNRANGGVDSAFSMEPAEMAQLLVETERAWQALGQVRYGPTGTGAADKISGAGVRKDREA